MMKNERLSDAEVDRIADKVLSRISVDVDISDALLKIEELRKALEELGGKR